MHKIILEWPRFKEYGSAEHLAAIGAISAIWNEIEQQFRVLVHMTIDGPPQVAAHISEILNIDNSKKIVELHLFKKLHEDEIDIILFIFEAISICRENRNIIMHSDIYRVSGEENLGLMKGVSKDRMRSKRKVLNIGEIRKIADEMYGIAVYFRHACALILIRMNASHAKDTSVLNRHLFKMPIRPKLPEKLYLE